MAMIKTTDEGLDINGRVGGTIFRSDQCGMHMQKEPRFILHWSEKQKAWMRAWSIVYKYWREGWEAGMHNPWWDYAHNHPVKNRKGETILLFAMNWFLKVNVTRIYNGLPIQWEPPTD